MCGLGCNKLTLIYYSLLVNLSLRLNQMLVFSETYLIQIFQKTLVDNGGTITSFNFSQFEYLC